MHEVLELMGSAIAGLGLGAIFFGGLWWTVRQAETASQPALWFAGSLLLRVALVLFGFYWVAGPSAMRLLMCLLGFAVARLLVTRVTRGLDKARLDGREATVQEAGHAP